MLAKDFIYKRLESLSQHFQSVQIKYGFNEWAKTHIIELAPIESYYKDRDLENAWIEIVTDFMGKYPAEDISFISSDSTLKIENPEFSFNIHEFQHFNIPSFHFAGIQDSLARAFNFLTVDVAFGDIIIPHQMSFPLSIKEFPTWDSINHFHFSNAHVIAKSLIPLAALEDPHAMVHFKEEGDSPLPSNTEYAMAA